MEIEFPAILAMAWVALCNLSHDLPQAPETYTATACRGACTVLRMQNNTPLGLGATWQWTDAAYRSAK
jgi:hypothetical protein